MLRATTKEWEVEVSESDLGWPTVVIWPLDAQAPASAYTADELEALVLRGTVRELLNEERHG